MFGLSTPIRNKKAGFLFVIPLVFLLAGCSGGGGGGDGGGSNPVSGIGPSGGSVTSSDGKATVTIPAGALSQDMNITVSRAFGAPAGNIGDAFDFGPDGTTFAQAVTIRIGFDSAALALAVSPSDLKLGRVVNGGWQEVPGSTVNAAAGTVSGQTSSFSVYGVIEVAGQTTTTSASSTTTSPTSTTSTTSTTSMTTSSTSITSTTTSSTSSTSTTTSSTSSTSTTTSSTSTTSSSTSTTTTIGSTTTTTVPSSGNKWDEMKWDEGQWGP